MYPPLKIEGIDVRQESRRLRLLFVTDADDGAIPIGLHEAADLRHR